MITLTLHENVNPVR